MEWVVVEIFLISKQEQTIGNLGILEAALINELNHSGFILAW